MAISVRNTILEQLKSDFARITVARGYQITVSDVRRGIPHSHEVTDSMPSITFTAIRSEKFVAGGDTFRETRGRCLHLIIWLHVQGDPDDNDYLDMFVADVEKFLESTDNTYGDKTYVGDYDTYEGGVGDPVGIAEMQARLYYDFTTDDI